MPYEEKAYEKIEWKFFQQEIATPRPSFEILLS